LLIKVPFSTLTSPSTIISSAITFSDTGGSGINPSTLQWTCNNSWATISSNTSTSTYTDSWSSNRNSTTCYYRIADYAGNYGQTEAFTIKIDTDVPTVSSVTASYTDSSLKVNVTASDSASKIASYNYYYSTSTTCPSYSNTTYTSSANSSYSFTVTASGTYKICVYVIDNAGNKTLGSTSLTVGSQNVNLSSSNIYFASRRTYDFSLDPSHGSTDYQARTQLTNQYYYYVPIGYDNYYTYHTIRVEMTFPTNATNVKLNVYTGSSVWMTNTVYYKTLATTNDCLWQQNPSSGCNSIGYADGSFTQPSTTYQLMTISLKAPNNVAFEANKTYYTYFWHPDTGVHLSGGGDWLFTTAGSYVTSVTYTQLS